MKVKEAEYAIKDASRKVGVIEQEFTNLLQTGGSNEDYLALGERLGPIDDKLESVDVFVDELFAHPFAGLTRFDEQEWERIDNMLEDLDWRIDRLQRRINGKTKAVRAQMRANQPAQMRANQPYVEARRALDALDKDAEGAMDVDEVRELADIYGIEVIAKILDEENYYVEEYLPEYQGIWAVPDYHNDIYQ